MIAIGAKNLTKSFGGQKILDNFQCQIQQGEVVLLRGESGSGKSTLLSLLAGFSKPDYGEVLCFDCPIFKLPQNHLAHFRSQNIGFVFQNFELLDDLSVFDNVAIPLYANGIPSSTKVLEVLNMCGVSHKSSLLSKHLSGGERARVCVARAIVGGARIIFADEPSANLDAKNTQMLIALFESLKIQKKTLIIATHDERLIHSKVVDRSINL